MNLPISWKDTETGFGLSVFQKMGRLDAALVLFWPVPAGHSNVAVPNAVRLV